MESNILKVDDFIHWAETENGVVIYCRVTKVYVEEGILYYSLDLSHTNKERMWTAKANIPHSEIFEDKSIFIGKDSYKRAEAYLNS